MSWAFDGSLLGAPLLAGLVVAATHVVLGREVLKRGIIFIDLTIAQVAALGVLAEAIWHPGGEHSSWHAQAGAVAAALAAALLLAWTERRWPQLQEALIGSLYVVASSAALLLLANHPHGHEQLTQLLAGQILWVNYERVWPVALLYAGVLALWFMGARRQPMLFYVLFAVTVTASVQLVGVFLVFASLILPALAVRELADRPALILGYALGAAAYALGLWLSVPTDLPSGPLVVMMLAALAGLAALVLSLNRARR